MISLYLAGPDVFMRDSSERGGKLTSTCREFGVNALYPADFNIVSKIEKMKVEGAAGWEIASMIFNYDKEMLDSCDGVIANLEPLRGPEADPGTTWEMGYAFGMGKPVWAYCSDLRPYHEKVIDWNAAPPETQDGIMRDKNGAMIDDLGETANLMMTRSVMSNVVHVGFLSALRSACWHFRHKIAHQNGAAQMHGSDPASHQ